MTQAKEIEIYESCNSNPQTYAKRVGRLLFEDTLNYYYKVGIRTRPRLFERHLGNPINGGEVGGGGMRGQGQGDDGKPSKYK